MEWTKTRDVLSWKRGGIRRRLLTTGCFFLALALLVNTLAGYFYTRMEMERLAAQIQSEVGARVAHEIENFVQRKVERLQDLAASVSFHGLESKNPSLLAHLLIKDDVSYSEVAVLDDKGMEILKISGRKVYLPSDFTDQSNEEKFTGPLAGRNFISPVYTSDKAEPYVTIAVPIRATPNKVVGVVTADLNLKFLWQIIGNITFGKAGYAYLVDNRGNLIAHKDPSQVLKRVSLAGVAPVRRFLQKPLSSDSEPGEEVPGLNGAPVLSTYAPVSGVGWAAILEEPLDEALSDLKRMRRFAWLLLAVGLAVGAAMIVVVSDEITKPIRELHRGVELIGSGNLDYRVEIKSGDEIERLAEGFNRMAAELEISYSTLEQQVAQRTHELSALYDVTTTVNQSLDLDVILIEVIQKVLEVMRFDAVRVYLLDAEGKGLRLRAHHGIGPEFASKTATDPVGVGINGTVIATGKPLIFEDIGTDPQYAQLARGKLAQEAGFHAHISLPLKTKTKTLGVINFLSYQVRALLPNEVALLTAMANQVGIALENIGLFEETREKAEKISVLYSVAEVVNESLGREIVLHNAMRKIMEVLEFDAARAYIFNKDTRDLRLIAHEGFPLDITLPPSYRPGYGIVGEVFETGQPIFFNDIQTNPEFHRLAGRRIILKVGFRGYLCLPIRAQSQVVGVINFLSKRLHEFLPEEIQLIHSVADQVGVALKNANLFEEVRQKSLELEKANRELQEANRAKSEFMAAMSHELRTPLNVIIGNADLSKDGFFGEVTPKQKDAMEKILRYSKVLLKLVNDVLTLTRIEAKKMTLEVSTFHLEEILFHIRTYTEQLNRDKRLGILWKVDSRLPPLTTDAMKLEEILQNLIGNAFKFTPKGKIELRVRDLPTKGRVEFAVVDTGIGIDESNLQKIFEEFHQLKDAHTGDYTGVGLGLSIVKKYLELMQGEIQVESRPGIGSVFSFTLPYSV